MNRKIRTVLVAALSAVLAVPMATVAVAQEAPAVPTTVTAVPLATWQTNGTVWAIEVVNGVAYVGGSFTKVRPPGAAPGAQEVDRRFLAAFDAVSGDLLPWNPLIAGNVTSSSDRNCPVVGTNLRECGTVWDIKKSPDGSRIFIGGDFNRVDGKTRPGLAGFATATGALDTVVKPGINGRVYGLAVSDSTVYAGGSFNSLAGGVARTKVAAFDRASGGTLPFAPVLDGNVRKITLSPDGSKLIIGGWFNTINGTGSRRLSAVNTSDGSNAVWADNRFATVAWVTDLKTIDGRIYVAGEASGTVNEGVDVYDPATGTRIWTDGCMGASHSLAVLRGVVYTGSHAHDCRTMVDGFTEQFNGQDPETQRRFKLRAQVQNGATATLLPWTPQTDDGNGPRAMATVGDDVLWVGGEFTVVNDNVPQQGLTRFGFAQNGAVQAAPLQMAAPRVFSSRPGRVTVTFPTGEDRDSRSVTYQVIRDGNAAAPVHEVTLESRPWAPGWYSWTDESVEPGATHTYELRGVDPDGNRGPRSAAASVTVATTLPAALDVPAIEQARLNYRLNEAAGPARDSIGGVRTANAGAGALFNQPGVPGLPGTAVTFSGAAGGSLGDPTREWAKKQVSVELWFRTTSTRGGKLLGMGSTSTPTATSGSSDRNVYLTSDGRVAWGVTPGARRAIFSAPGLNNGQWHHVVATLDAVAGTRLYVDGTQVAADATATWSNAFNGWWRIGGDTLSGWPSRPASDYFAGTIDEVAIYPYPITAAQAQRHFRLGDPANLDTTAPSVPADVTATVDRFDVTLGWSASTDDDQVARYRVYRGSTADFTPSADTLLRQTSQTQTVDTGLTPGTWYYRVSAVDATGNESAASDAVAAEVVEPEPVPVSVVATEDAWVNSNSPDGTTGTSWVLRSRGGTPEQATYLKVRLPDAPAGKSLDSAMLSLATSDNAWAGAAGEFQVRLVGDSSWQESTLTWTTRPAVSDTVLGTIPAGTTVAQAIDVTLDAPALAAFAGQTVTLAVVSTSTDNLELRSKESSTGKPTLTVLYR